MRTYAQQVPSSLRHMRAWNLHNPVSGKAEEILIVEGVRKIDQYIYNFLLRTECGSQAPPWEYIATKANVANLDVS